MALARLYAQVEQPTSGWDPYDVWRTRVLLPRLAEERNRLPQLAVAKTHPVVAPRTDINRGSSNRTYRDLDYARDDRLEREAAGLIGWLVVSALANIIFAAAHLDQPR